MWESTTHPPAKRWMPVSLLGRMLASADGITANAALDSTRSTSPSLSLSCSHRPHDLHHQWLARQPLSLRDKLLSGWIRKSCVKTMEDSFYHDARRGTTTNDWLFLPEHKYEDSELELDLDSRSRRLMANRLRL